MHIVRMFGTNQTKFLLEDGITGALPSDIVVHLICVSVLGHWFRVHLNLLDHVIGTRIYVKWGVVDFETP
jgi:hypothetical protein